MSGLNFQRFSLLSSQSKVWWRAGRHGAGEGAESSTSWITGSWRQYDTLGVVWSHDASKPASAVTNLFQQGYNHPNKVIPLSDTTSSGPSIQTREPMGNIPIHITKQLLFTIFGFVLDLFEILTGKVLFSIWHLMSVSCDCYMASPWLCLLSSPLSA